MSGRNFMLLVGGTAVASLAFGCDSRPTLSPETAQAIYEIARANPPSTKADQVSFAAMDWSLGRIPFTGRTLPLTSPDGKWLASETGPPVATSTLLALPSGPIPENSGIEVWSIDSSRASVTSHLRLRPPLLLGTSADAEGFLVEAPRPDGSRWIAKVAWETGEFQWLVQDENVNAFGSLGPDGELAWCTRPVHENAFSLVIRFSDGEEMGIAPRGGEWLLPSWSTRSSRLSAFFLADSGVLSLLSLDARTPELLQGPTRQFDLMTGGRRADALQARRGQPVIQGMAPPWIEEVIFYHPTSNGVYVWLPMNIQREPPFGLATDSTVAINDPLSKGYLVSTTGDLRWQNPDNRMAFVRVRYGPAIPRGTTSTAIPFLMFVPDTDELEIRALVPQAEGQGTPTSPGLPEAPMG